MDERRAGKVLLLGVANKRQVLRSDLIVDATQIDVAVVVTPRHGQIVGLPGSGSDIGEGCQRQNTRRQWG